jgi:rubredoxin-NAD+ reductase
MYVAPLTLSAKALAHTLNGDVTPVAIPASPVIVKTPTCPVVANPPLAGAEGRWEIEGDSPDLKACFYSEDNQLLGFGLTGNKVRERMKLAKQLPAIL